MFFIWKLQQDMLPVGARLHRRNAEKRCLEELASNRTCLALQTREHVFIECESVAEVFPLSQ